MNLNHLKRNEVFSTTFMFTCFEKYFEAAIYATTNASGYIYDITGAAGLCVLLVFVLLKGIKDSELGPSYS